MPGATMTVLIASERPEARRLLARVVAEERGAVVVGQVDNGVGALNLARRLRPDVVVVDSQLPHLVGLDAVRLSRTGGLDTAMGILQELPAAGAVLLNDLDQAFHPDKAPSWPVELSRYGNGGGAAVTLGELFPRSGRAAALAFARVRLKEQRAEGRLAQIVEMSERAALYSGLGVLAGLGLMLTLIFFAPGAVVALAAIGLLLASLAVRVVVVRWTGRRVAQRRSAWNVQTLKEGARDGAEAGRS